MEVAPVADRPRYQRRDCNNQDQGACPKQTHAFLSSLPHSPQEQEAHSSEEDTAIRPHQDADRQPECTPPPGPQSGTVFFYGDESSNGTIKRNGGAEDAQGLS